MKQNESMKGGSGPGQLGQREGRYSTYYLPMEKHESMKGGSGPGQLGQR